MADFDAAALAAARRYCGWHVTPIDTTTVTLDGPGSPVLFLPTLHVQELVSLSEDGTEVDVDTLTVTTDGRVYKQYGSWWSNRPAAITVEFTHGFDEALDFDAAVGSIEKSLTASDARGDSALIRKRVDDVEYQWDGALLSTTGASTADGLLASYRLERQA